MLGCAMQGLSTVCGRAKKLVKKLYVPHHSRAWDVRFYVLVDGKDVWESAQLDEIVDACLELNGPFWHLAKENDPEKKSEGFARKLVNTKEAYFSELNRTLKANGEFLVGNGLTWADICVAHFVDNIQTIFSVDIVVEFPELKRHIEMVYSLPGI